jgi:hypothetical protein
MIDTQNSRPLDRAPFFWMLGLLGLIILGVMLFYFAGQQRLHNSALWQRLHPVMQVSPVQTGSAVDVHDTRRVAYTVVQTEKGLYFLTGAKNIPPPNSRLVVETNDRWDLFLCAADGSRCMTIHSFCANIVWPNVQRDEEGRLAGCHAPHLGPLVEALPEVRPLTAVPGGVGKRKPLPPPVGISHPREWAWRMGLPKPPE